MKTKTCGASTLDKLEADLREGAIIAAMAAEDGDDGGTSNFDAVSLRFDAAPSLGARRELLQVAKAAGLDARFEGKNRQMLIDPGVPGQGERRRRAAEAFARHLRLAGWDTASVYYQAD